MLIHLCTFFFLRSDQSVVLPESMICYVTHCLPLRNENISEKNDDNSARTLKKEMGIFKVQGYLFVLVKEKTPSPQITSDLKHMNQN
jgi:hypothetical protein